MRWAIGELVGAFAPPVDPVLVSLATGPLRPAVPLGRLRGDRAVSNLAEIDPDAGLPDFKVKSHRVAWW
ncbi:MAG: hypothetical protein FJZ01_08155 [Candidatus Sericytochromatia bacterium]|nr:hypothetical protein [Candidatus Tanganyikabacteria bacterium]